MTDRTSENVLSDALQAIALDDTLGRGIRLLRPRATEFSGPLALTLAGVAAVPDARRRLDDELDMFWGESVVTDGEDADEWVIGAGPHAAVYCAARVLKGFPKPKVLERGRVGGMFAVSRDPSFWLNSRNRPGQLGLPGEGLGLNVLPGAVVQPAEQSNREFQDNSALAYSVRTTLARYADVRTGSAAMTVRESQGGRDFAIECYDGKVVFGDRVIDARGLGDPIGAELADDETILTFPQLMARMDTAFPLRGLKRVAVVGNGDSARCAVESLLGIAPANHLSVAALDFVEAVDWFAPGLPLTCEAWRETQRGRYQAIGSSLNEAGLGRTRLRIFEERGVASEASGQAYVNERLYDLVVLATGWELPLLSGIFSGYETLVGGSPFIARQFGGGELYQVGPAADIPLSVIEQETDWAKNTANTRALFRTIGRTAALGARLLTPTAP